MNTTIIEKLNQFKENLNTIKSKNNQTTVLFLTGAGISAESGIPVFRGPGGFWTVGSENYTSEKMANSDFFRSNPELVWSWYLWRLYLCNTASPNNSHRQITLWQKYFDAIPEVNIELITQNIDRLHHRAATNNIKAIHGDITQMRCSNGCHHNIYDIPLSEISRCITDEQIRFKIDSQRQILSRDNEFKTAISKLIDNQDVWDLLKCKKCAGLMRPHVLWFNETYDEQFYYIDTCMELAKKCDLLFIIGTAGQTNLPNMIYHLARKNKSMIINIDLSKNHFSELSEGYEDFLFLPYSATNVLPKVTSVFLGG